MDADRDAGRWLIVGLGNPGTRYAGNRHNVGFMVAESLASLSDLLTFRMAARFKGELALGRLRRHEVALLKPQTYMNLSGESAQPLAHFYRIPIERVIAIHDDVDLELGRLKIKQGGGDAGHNGLRSLTDRFGSSEYIRIRFGVGRPEFGEVADYVLSDFRQEEHELLTETLDRAQKSIFTILSRGLKEAMNRHNRVPKKKSAAKEPAGPGPSTLEASATNRGAKGDPPLEK
ncbi:MAG: aminoacyl-tRNA hydrolase [Deltaproteobacteria bacterium]|nr:aminoacyl-tRNA hydrolase [Deltaproteobacteria bacterium]